MNSQARRVLILVNPRAGRRATRPKAEELAARLELNGFTVAVLDCLDAIVDRALRLHEEGDLRAVVAAGGDGTATSVAKWIPPSIPLAPFPLGTENLLARHLGLRPCVEQMCTVISENRTITLDIGRANGQMFLLMLGCGFDAEVVRLVHKQRQGHITRWSYAAPICVTARCYRFPELKIHCFGEAPHVENGAPLDSSPPYRTSRNDDTTKGASSPWLRNVVFAGPQVTCARWGFVFNLPCYGGGLRLAPQADGTDGLLDVLAFTRGSLWHGLRYMAAVVRQRHRELADCSMARCTRVRIEADQPVPYQLDGDAAGWLPVDVTVDPARLTVLIDRRSLTAPIAGSIL
jgi:diacylglycerol kinase (ATP)